MDPSESWEEFGPPANKNRWCCAVHKSVPTMLKLRDITGRSDIKAVVYSNSSIDKIEKIWYNRKQR